MDIDPYISPAAAGFDPSGNPNSSPVSNAVVDQLTRTRPWVLFMAVMLFIGVGLMLLFALAMLGMSAAGMAKSSPGMAGMGGMMMPMMASIYALMGFMYVYPGVKLAKYAAAIRRLSYSRTEAELVHALDQQRGFWKFVGVMMIIIIGLYVLLILGAVIVGVTAASGMHS